MVDFESGKLGGFDADNGANQEFDAGSNLLQDVAARYAPGTQILNVDANGSVTLPAGVSPQDITVQGRDLVINLADGTVLVIPDGAIIVPQIVIDGVAIPPETVADLLNGIDPEAGPGQGQGNPASSGGNFALAEGSIQDAFDLGNLLPYTELFRPVVEEVEIIPSLVDRDPDVVIITPDNPVGVENAIATVDEDGLPPRDDGEGPSEPPGTRDETNSETTSGTIVFQTPDGLSAIFINGVELTTIGQTFVSPFGTLTITSINLATGVVGFSYTLDDNTLGISADGFFSVTVRDTDGDEASASLSIIVIDDSPIAANDIGIVPGGTFGPITGNVLVNDESGADDYPDDGEGGVEAVTGFSNADGSAQPGDSLQGEYGVLTLNADGSYTYTRDFNTLGGVTDTFTYTIIDQDGSTDTATLTINIGDAPNSVTLPEIGEGTVVDEGGLPPRDGEPVGTGEGSDGDPDNNSDTTEGTGSTITFNSPDGLASVTINGVAIDPDNLPQTIVSDATGTLVITGFTYDPVTGDGTITYEYTLGDNTSGDDTSVTFEIVVTDLDGDEASDDLVITIVDDEPLAVDDSATQDAENAPITVDVFANDVEGADGVALDAIALVADTLTGGGELVYNGDGTFTYTPAPGEEGTVTFDYSITDGDGDPSVATVTIDLLEDSTSEIFTEGDETVNESGLDGPPDSTFEGSDSGAASEFATGVIGISTGNDSVASLVINGTDVTAGGTVAGDYGTLTVTFDGTDYSYSYELDNNITDVALVDEVDSFSLTVTDSDGDEASTTLDITVIDDVPLAVDDTDSLTEDGPVFTSGNVITDAEANGDNGADTTGADAAVVQNAGEIVGVYGTLVLGADGGYTYTLSAFGISQLSTLGDGEFFTEVFDYTLVDGDGDESEATLTITLNGADDGVTINGLDGQVPEVVLDEDDLDNLGDDQGSDQSDPLFQNGSFGVTSPDGLDDVQVNGVDVVVDGVFQGSTEVANDGIYSVEITGWTPVFAADGVTVISATFDYTATLLDNTLAHDELGQDDIINMLTVTADDSDGSSDSAVLDVQIIDDVPTANDDGVPTPIAVAEDTPTQIDVIANDVEGADGVAFGDIALETQATNGTAVYNGDGTFTYTPDAGYSGGDSFTYTITDGDGDPSTATVFVNVGTDSVPEFNAGNSVVDEDGLPGANLDSNPLQVSPAETNSTEDNTDTVSFTVDFGNDTPLDVDAATAFINPDSLDGQLSSDGQPVDFALDGNGDLVGTVDGGATVVIRISLNAGSDQLDGTVDYSYTVTLSQPLDHADDESENSALLNGVTIQVTDSDASQSSDTFTVTIVDDVPTAVDDTVNQPAENAVVVGDVSSNDVEGVDSPATYALNGDHDGAGDLVFNTDGSFTYTPAVGEAGTVTFSYTITDTDGDTDTATVTINLEDDSKPAPNNAVAAVDDDGLGGGNAGADAATDLDADVGDGGAGLGDESVFVGTFTADFGNDGPGTFTLEGMDATSGTVGTENVDYSWDADTNTLTATINGGDRDGVDLFTVEVNPATGDYTVTLLEPVMHEDDGTDTENDASAVLTFTAIDSEGDPTDGSLTITFDDDVPTANDDSFTQGTENEAVTGNVSDDNGNGADVEGADSPVSYAYNDDHDGTGTLDFNSDGSFTYTPTDGEEGTVTFTYTLTDADGDESTAEVTIELEDDSTPTAGIVTARVDDDGLAGGNNPNNAGDDLDANTDGNNNDIVFVGTLTGSAGLDGPATFSLAGMDTLNGTAGLETVTYSWDALTDTLTATTVGGTRPGTDLFTVEIIDVNTGAYTVTLLTNFLHDGGDDGELAGGVDSLGLTYTVSDSDTPADSAPGTLTIQFGDDAPLAFTPDSVIIQDGPTDSFVVGDLNLSIGADTPAQIEFSIADGTPVIDGNTGEPVTVGGVALKYFSAPNGDLVATTGTAYNNGVIGFTVELAASGTGSYQFNIFEDLSNGTTTTFSNLGSSAAGNVDFRVIGKDTGPADETDVLLNAVDASGNPISVNTDSDSIGAGNQSIGANQSVRITFLQDIDTDATVPISETELQWNATVQTTQFHQEIAQVQGSESLTAGIDVYAVNSTLASGVAPDADPDGGFDDGPSVVIQTVEVFSFADNTTYTFNLTGFTDEQSLTIDDYTVIFHNDGTNKWVSIIGLQESNGPGANDSYTINTGLNQFNSVVVTVLPVGEYGLVDVTSQDLDLGIFSIGSFNAGEDIELSFNVTVTDEDGDTASGTINVAVDQDGSSLPVTPVVLDLDGGGNQFSGLNAGVAYDYDSDGAKTKTAWIAAGSAILAFDANGDGMVTDASEFAFGSDGMTDLEALAAKYDTNQDGKLDAADAEYGKFGVWIDGDLDAVSDSGEFVSLADAGITSIDLVSDGIAYDAADGDVSVFGTASFTWADGSTGTVADAGFATGGDVDMAMMEALLALTVEDAPANDNLSDVASLQGSQELPDVVSIVEDVMAVGVIDAMIDHIAGDTGAMAVEASYLGSAAMALKIDGGAFAFDAFHVADMSEEAAAMAAVSA